MTFDNFCSPFFYWRSYGQVFDDIQNAAKGIIKLPGIGEKRMQKQQVVAALLAETSQEWMISAQAGIKCICNVQYEIIKSQFSIQLTDGVFWGACELAMALT